ASAKSNLGTAATSALSWVNAATAIVVRNKPQALQRYMANLFFGIALQTPAAQDSNHRPVKTQCLWRPFGAVEQHRRIGSILKCATSVSPNLVRDFLHVILTCASAKIRS